MRVLIVHAFAKSGPEAKKRERFIQFVQETVRQRSSSEAQFEIRDYQNIRDFTLCWDEQQLRKEPLASFDRLDFIFVDGSNKLLPWSPAAKQLCTLMKMCFDTGKSLFCTNFGALVMAYTVACCGEIYPIVNGGGRGDHSVVPSKIPRPERGKEGQFYLDNATGDIFGYSNGDGRWVSVSNCGLHRHGAPKVYDTYRVQTSRKDIAVQPSFGELTLHRAKRNYHHWIYDDVLENEFLVPLDRAWNLHVPKRQENVSVLGDSVFGIEIIEYGHMVGMNFPISEYYPQTLTMLGNFISQKVILMSKYDRVEYISQRLFQQAASEGLRINPSLLNRRTGSTHKVDTDSEEDDVITDRLRQSTARISDQRTHPDIVTPLDLGAMSPAYSSAITTATNRSSSKIRSATRTNPHATARPIPASQTNPLVIHKLQSEMNLLNGGGKAAQMYRNVQLGLDDAPPPPANYDPAFKQEPVTYYLAKATPSGVPAQEDGKPVVKLLAPSSRPKSAPLSSHTQVVERTTKEQTLSPGVSHKSKPNISTIRKISDVPTVRDITNSPIPSQQEFMHDRNFTASPKNIREVDRDRGIDFLVGEANFVAEEQMENFELDEGTSAAQSQRKKVVRVPPPARPYTAYKKFEKMKKAELPSDNHPITNTGPYISQEDMDRIETIENKKKWVGADFRVLPLNRSQSRLDMESTSSFHQIPFTGRGPSFRNEDRTRWISGNFTIFKPDKPRSATQSSLSNTIYTRATTPTDKSSNY